MAVSRVALVAGALMLAGCGTDRPSTDLRTSPDSYWPVGTCILADGGEAWTSVRSVACSTAHTHVVIARLPLGARCPAATDTEFEDAANKFCLLEDVQLRSDGP